MGALRRIGWTCVRRTISLALALAGAAACTPFEGDAAADAGPQTSPFQPVAAIPEAIEAGPPCDPDAAFDTIVAVAGLSPASISVNTTSVGGLRLSPDYRTAYFYADRGDRDFDDLFVASRSDPTSPFDRPLPFGGPINSALNETDPSLSGDGKMLVFARGEAGGAFEIHLWGAKRSEVYLFSPPALLEVNDLTAAYDMNPFLREDGQSLYFASSRVPSDGTDIYRAALGPSPSPPAQVTELSTPYDELAPVVTPDDLVIFWGSDRTDDRAAGLEDIWMATRSSPDAGFAGVRNVRELNTPALDLPTFVSRDGCALYFSSARDGSLQPYVATKRRAE